LQEIAEGVSSDLARPIGIASDLRGVSETMLWSLHNRASEAKRADGMLRDLESIAIHSAIDYDFERHFGKPGGSLAVRAAAIDRVLRLWLEAHPYGLVVSLGEGLDSQRSRVDNGRMRWLSVDLPGAIQMRERFLLPTDRFRHLSLSVLDPAWMEGIDAAAGLFIVAQGLLMYLDGEKVRQLLSQIAERFPGVEVVFDVVPRWFSSLTMMGLWQTPHYRLPPMPWGIGCHDIAATLQSWHWRFDDCRFLTYGPPRGFPLLLTKMMQDVPSTRQGLPCLVHVITTTTDRNKTMRLIDSETGNTGGLDGVLAAANLNARRSRDLASAAGQVVAKRLALGVASTLRPSKTNHAEFARMVPEKVEAFSAASLIMLQQSNKVRHAVVRFASDEMQERASAASVMLAGGMTPMGLAAMQHRLIAGWFARASAGLIAMSMLTLQAHDAAMAPIREQVDTNVNRLAA
jgi:O-methyltransferase involved in polyketide biosynthesis